MGPINLVIVLDDTDSARFDESRAIAQEILVNLGNNVDGNFMQVTVVSSSQSVVMTASCEYIRIMSQYTLLVKHICCWN